MSVIITEPIISGIIVIKTSLGEIKIELWSKECPKTCKNLIQLALEGYYDNSIFHRIVPGFIAQTGAPGSSGDGGECIYDEGVFPDEFNQRLSFNRRGLVAMANQGPNSNMSQFFFTLDATPELQNRNTIFGRVVGDTLYNILALSDLELIPGTDRPMYPPFIKSIQVLDNPFAEIVPRITAKERKEQDKAKREMKLERKEQREKDKRKGTKNKSLLSFGAEPDETEPTTTTSKFKSSHDALDDPRLRKEVKDDRGTSVNVPASIRMLDQKPTSMPPPPLPTPSTSKLVAARVEKAKSIQPKDKVKADIAAVEADLKALSRTRNRGDHSSSDDDDDDADASTRKKAKKAKRVGPSLLQLEREKYLKTSNATTTSSSTKSSEKGKAKREDADLEDVLAGFRTRVQGAVKTAKLTVPEPEEEGVPGEIVAKEGFFSVGGDVDDDDDGWLSHSLVFRKDATLDKHSTDEYSTYDPLVKNSLSLDELKAKADNGPRKYARDNNGNNNGSSARRGSGRDGGRGDRRDDRRDEGRRGGESASRDSWKNDRVRGA